MHQDQATAGVRIGSAEHQAKIDAMIGDVLQNLDDYFDCKGQGEVIVNLQTRAQELRAYLREHAAHTAGLDCRIFLIREALLGNRPAWQHLASLATGRKRWPMAAPESVQSWFAGNGLIRLF